MTGSGRSMAREYRSILTYIQKILTGRKKEDLLNGLQSRTGNHKPKVPQVFRNSPESVNELWDLIDKPQINREILWDPQTARDLPLYDMNIENLIGVAKIPIGLVGPLRVNGLFANGDYYIPMATTEAALISSYNRGAQLLSDAGGCSAMILSEGVTRAPVFVFNNLKEAATFLDWSLDNVEVFQGIAAKHTKHGRMSDMRISVNGSQVFLIFEYSTGDASGQNMVTICTEAVYTYILQNTPIKPQVSYLESNLSGDKKATAQAFQIVRGKKVTADVTIPRDLFKQGMGITPEQLAEYFHVSCSGSILSGSIGAQAHIANALAAIYMACGQDVACVGESSVGITTGKLTNNGDFYASVTLPNLMVGTIGGGTGLPTQRACLEIMGLYGNNCAAALAEVIAGIVLAGEISISCSLASGQFSRAHELLARIKKNSYSF